MKNRKVRFRSKKNRHSDKHTVIPISAPVKPMSLADKGISVESTGRRGFLGHFTRDKQRTFFVRVRDEDGRVFNLKVVGMNEEEAKSKVLVSFPRVKAENIERISPYKEGLGRTILRTLGRGTAELIRKSAPYVRKTAEALAHEARSALAPTPEELKAEAAYEAAQGEQMLNGDYSGDEEKESGHGIFDDNGEPKKKGSFKRKSEEDSGGILGGSDDSEDSKGFFD